MITYPVFHFHLILPIYIIFFQIYLTSFIRCIYLYTSTSIAANTTLVLLELIFEIICLRQISSRHALVELLSKWYHGSRNLEISVLKLFVFMVMEITATVMELISIFALPNTTIRE